MTLDIRPLDPYRADQETLDGYHLMRAAAWAADFPEDPPMTREAAVGRLRTPPVHEGPGRTWTGHLGGRLAGSARVSLPEAPNEGIAWVEVHVHPELRRRGFGTELLRSVLPAVLESGRGTVFGLPMKPDAAAASWVAGLGFDVTHSTVMQLLRTTEVPARGWEVPVPDGYRLVQWTGPTPEELVESYALARRAVNDAPQGRTSYRAPRWTADQIRTEDREVAEAGIEPWVAVAVEEATGQVAGMHVVHHYQHRPAHAFVQDTAVLAAHRGRGLGRAVKAGLMRQLLARRPDLELVFTTTAATNTHMIDINHALGYRTARTMNWVEIPTARLVERLAQPLDERSS
ncbi:GNAT family N-acetyltransferase [Streptomyces tateyamensis]|uniref:GNAT family N-acetyltransferase n=1 Tax=Streptomyces tateyamensis TaxID=565073 RepID=UPI0015E8B387|nr:GNAT family N-acetyltransferase [Streptomyces tateyamensis]